MQDNTMKIAVLAGDGIGPEVMSVATAILEHILQAKGASFELREAAVGGVAIDTHGSALPQQTLDTCNWSDAILFGSVGGPKWEGLPPEQRPERGALLPLRKAFNLYANLRPAIIFPQLKAASPLKDEIIGNRFDLLVVRELTGGIYFGQPKGREGNTAFDTLVYSVEEIERIAHLAFQAAQKRGGRVTSVDKANVLSSMVLWREVVESVSASYADVELNHMYVDNATMQLVKNPSQFDVLLCPNMFGDIISDEASMITGSLGMLPSASLSDGKFGLYEPSGGSAPDIAGQGIANPIAQILSMAMMLKYSFSMDDAHDAVFKAISRVLDDGYRTGDIMSPGCTNIGTEEMGQRILEALN